MPQGRGHAETDSARIEPGSPGRLCFCTVEPGHRCLRRPVLQPGLHGFYRSRASRDEDLDPSVIEIYCMSVETELARLLRG